MKLLLRESGLPLGNVARNGNGRAAQLTGKSVKLGARKLLGCQLDFGDKLHGFLPCDQFPIGTSHTPSTRDYGIVLRLTAVTVNHAEGSVLLRTGN